MSPWLHHLLILLSCLWSQGTRLVKTAMNGLRSKTAAPQSSCQRLKEYNEMARRFITHGLELDEKKPSSPDGECLVACVELLVE